MVNIRKEEKTLKHPDRFPFDANATSAENLDDGASIILHDLLNLQVFCRMESVERT
jgi:hypothetical protein